MDVLTFKAIAIITILATGLMGGYLSFRIARSKRSALLFSIGNVFAGGIFLGAGFIHMLGDSYEAFADYDFPWAMFLCACGFLLILLVERVLFRVHEHHEDELNETADPENSSKPDGPATVRPEQTQPPLNPLVTYILAIVLGIHSLIAGIALGAEKLIGMAAVILIAILAHKGSAVFALGVNLHRSDLQKSTIMRTLVIFSFITPLGVVIGSILNHLLTGEAENLMEGSFDALAAGTFLYVAIMEIFQEEFEDPERKGVKFLIAMMGLVLMALLALWV